LSVTDGLFEHVLTTGGPELPFRADALRNDDAQPAARARRLGGEETTLRCALIYDGEVDVRLRFSPEAPLRGSSGSRRARVVLHEETEGAFTCAPSAAQPHARAPEPHHFRYADAHACRAS
jgi:hypothetical protein